jgi:transposase-like protein
MARRRRRSFSAEFKFETVVEALRGEKTAAQICRERDISENLLSRWKQEFIERGVAVFEQGSSSKADETEQRIADLERMVGRLALENEILKKASSWLESERQKNGR